MIERVRTLRESQGAEIELLFLDDKSNDGSVEAVDQANLDWVRIIERDGERGLSPAVIEGFRTAENPVLICMDCDL
ncbi:MAG: glycosyltransferase, partial [Pseudomonadota bacterium]